MMLHLVQTASVRFSDSRSNAANRASQAARHLYQRACTLGWLGHIKAALTGQSPYLLNLAEVTTTHAAGNRYSTGLQMVPICQIQGSQGRCHEFDRNFHPLQDHLKSRWLRVATAWHMGIALPPVELIQVGDVYFVRDGHHRISVAKALGQLEINAEVRVWSLKH